MTKHNQSALDVVDFMQRRIATGIQVHVFLVGKRVIGLQSAPKGRSLIPHQQDRTKEQIKDRGIKGEFMHSLNKMPMPLML
jgi:hypothetical protein